MGYRSDWRIVFNTPGRAAEVMAWLEKEAKAGQSYSDLLQEMLDYAVSVQTADVIELEGTCWKVYDWDELTCAFHTKWDDDEEIDFAYIRLGEDLGDADLCNGDYTYLCACHSIGDTDCNAVPRVKKENVDVEPEHRPPLKCTCGGFGEHSDWCDLITGEYSEGVY